MIKKIWIGLRFVQILVLSRTCGDIYQEMFMKMDDNCFSIKMFKTAIEEKRFEQSTAVIQNLAISMENCVF